MCKASNNRTEKDRTVGTSIVVFYEAQSLKTRRGKVRQDETIKSSTIRYQ